MLITIWATIPCKNSMYTVDVLKLSGLADHMDKLAQDVLICMKNNMLRIHLFKLLQLFASNHIRWLT
jgi:hypothetical protein